ncbi:MAG: hypothetical protein JO266_15495 [Acidobacteria bacterium]|nr:hypothetical protein [Acidobacteriota bacterium]
MPEDPIKDRAAAILRHIGDRRVETVINTFHIHAANPVKIPSHVSSRLPTWEMPAVIHHHTYLALGDNSLASVLGPLVG